MDVRKLYIDGAWVEGETGAMIDIEDPATHEVVARVPRGSEKDVDKAVQAARKAFETWQYTPLETRVELMKKVVAGLKSRRQELIETITKELGSPYTVSADVHTDPFLLEAEHYIEVAANFQYEVRRNTSVVRREPVGVVGGLTPWNFPLEQIEKKVVPALLAGNCVVLKPSQFTPLTAYILTEEIDKAGYPHGVFNLVTGRGGEVGNALSLHPDVDMISFTGSTDAGREVARMGLTNIKKIALELGGKSAAVFLKGGDWENGVKGVLDTVMLNAGQTCNALTRTLVPRDELAKAEEILVRQAAEYKFGPMDDPATTLGPLSSRKQFDRVKKYIELGIEEGARVLIGGVPEDNGSYVAEPTIFSDVTRNMRIAQEEIFGPVLVVLPYDTVEEAVEIANDSIYGLAGAVYGPEEEANMVARQMKTGTVYVNEGQWDVASPFGGYKQSGLGREGGVEGYEEFLEVKTIYDK